MGYVIKFIPKYKNSGYYPFILEPMKNRVSWSKTRAKQEAEFHKKNFKNVITGLKICEIYNYRVIKR
jgi:hypothetical protein